MKKKPVNSTRRAVQKQEVYTKDDVIQLPIRSNDEIGDLYHEFQSMQDHIVENTEKLTTMLRQQSPNSCSTISDSRSISLRDRSRSLMTSP